VRRFQDLLSEYLPCLVFNVEQSRKGGVDQQVSEVGIGCGAELGCVNNGVLDCFSYLNVSPKSSMRAPFSGRKLEVIELEGCTAPGIERGANSERAVC
jgi:hypothetical protein